MEKSRKVFFSVYTYIICVALIIILTSIFLFSNYWKHTLINLLLGLPLSFLLTCITCFIIYLFKHKLRTSWSLLIFFICYIFSLAIIFPASLVEYKIWFYLLSSLSALFSLIWLIGKLIYEINNKKDILYLNNFFLPFSLMCIFVGLFFSFYTSGNKTIDNYQRKGLEIFNKIASEIEKELNIENNNLFRIKFIAFNDQKDTLDIGCLASEGYYYHLYSYDYSDLENAEQIFEKIETQTSFPSYTKNVFVLDEINSFINEKPDSISNNYQCVSYINYIKNNTNMCDAIIKNGNSYATFSVDINASKDADVYTYGKLGNSVLANLQKA